LHAEGFFIIFSDEKKNFGRARTSTRGARADPLFLEKFKISCFLAYWAEYSTGARAPKIFLESKNLSNSLPPTYLGCLHTIRTHVFALD